MRLLMSAAPYKLRENTERFLAATAAADPSCCEEGTACYPPTSEDCGC